MSTTLILILCLPLAGFAVQIFFARVLPRRGDWLASAWIFAGLALSTLLFVRMLGRMDPGYLETISWEWINLDGFRVAMGFFVDNLTIIMLMVVTVVSAFVHLYSIGYMRGDPRYSRYFGYLNLFTFSMLGIVLCDNLIALYVFWELVGLSSYLLIGFWYEKDSASDAGKKAFLTTRVGDVFMFIGIMMVYSAVGTFNFVEIFQAVAQGELSGTRLTVAGMFLFGGAVGKSAQFPLHVWLPDAMEGPTPVSALIHAATMVAAGVYMVGRLFPMLTHDALLLVAYIGLATAMLGATVAMVQTDIKRALAYSTVSQLGYMMAALGVGGLVAGMFHLMTHAYFKALLFLGSGSVIHAAHTQEMPEMGGLRRKMPVTFWTFVIATLAISGIFPFSGFFSKDKILAAALAFGMESPGHMVIFILLLLGAGITAFYMFRIIFLTFTGQPRDRKIFEHAHESPWVMTVPLAVLGLLSVVSAWGGWFEKLITVPQMGLYAAGGAEAAHGAAEAAHAAAETAHGAAQTVHGAATGAGGAEHGAAGHGVAHTAHTIAMIGGLTAALAGILLSYLFYFRRTFSAEAAQKRWRPLHVLLSRKYYFDELYSLIFVRPLLAVSRGFGRFDNKVIDGAVNGSAWLTRALSFFIGLFDDKVIDGAVNGVAATLRAYGGAIRRAQTGRFQNYALGLVAVSLVLMMFRIFGVF
ncbi:MAG: NADH-quinone oxidoreductase subunit L [Candidatus Eisenbacteria bacterium]|nr:NADH-quinone oxidoreductase subunit L [Candidatus Eisenbacteria bacterium]